MEHNVAAWAPVVRRISDQMWGQAITPEGVSHACTFLDAVQRGCAVLPEVPRDTAATCMRVALRLAIWNDHVHTVQLLLELYSGQWNSNWGQNDPLPLHLAAFHGATGTTVALIEARADLEATCAYCTPLTLAVRNGQSGTVALLLARKAWVGGSRWQGPLQSAAVSSDTGIVSLLLEANAQVNDRDSDGTALCCAANAGNADAVTMLLQKGKAEVNLANQWGWTPLHHAAHMGHVQCVSLLLEAGADVNNTNELCGMVTPLVGHLTHMKCPDVHLVTILVRAKADVNKPAVSVCRDGGLEHILDVLLPAQDAAARRGLPQDSSHPASGARLP